jgi:oligopeptide transport system substrate-binding protein
MPNPTNLDPVSLSRFDLTGRDLAENLFIGLTRLNARTGQIEPWLAQSWQVSADGLTWTFSLRSDVQWVQRDLVGGQPVALRPVVAGDVVYAVQRACDPDRPSPVADNLHVIVGCRAFATNNSLQALPAETLGIRALDDTTLEIRLLFPASYFLTITSLPEMRPLPSEYINDSLGIPWFGPTSAVTSGAWLMQEWVANSTLQLIRNPFWPMDYEGNLEAITVRFDVPLDDLANQVTNGAVEVARIDPLILANNAPLAEQLKANDGPSLTLLGFGYNNLTPEGLPLASPLDNLLVRRALALALDRPALASAVYGRFAAPVDHFTPTNVIAAPATRGAAFDPSSAQALLAQAGYPNCTGMGTLNFGVSSDPQETLLAQNIVLQWQTNLGCPVETFALVQAPRSAILDSARNALDVTSQTRYALWIIKWTGDYPDANAWLPEALHCEDGYFRTGRLCDATDGLLDQAGLSSDITARFTAYGQAEDAFFGLQGSFPAVPLLMEQVWWAQPANLSGLASYGPFQFDRWVKADE